MSAANPVIEEKAKIKPVNSRVHTCMLVLLPKILHCAGYAGEILNSLSALCTVHVRFSSLRIAAIIRQPFCGLSAVAEYNQVNAMALELRLNREARAKILRP